MNKIDPKQTIFYTIENAIKTYRKFAQKNISDEMSGITVDQMLVLTVLEANPDIAQNEMAELLFKDYASITRMIELLVKNDYLSRAINEADRRKFVLNISDKGHSTLKKLKPIILKNRTKALKGVSESEVNQMFTTLNKIINNC
jgi:DNA-binding MarR family transcriptional regulator